MCTWESSKVRDSLKNRTFEVDLENNQEMLTGNIKIEVMTGKGGKEEGEKE